LVFNRELKAVKQINWCLRNGFGALNFLAGSLFFLTCPFCRTAFKILKHNSPLQKKNWNAPKPRDSREAYSKTTGAPSFWTNEGLEAETFCGLQVWLAPPLVYWPPCPPTTTGGGGIPPRKINFGKKFCPKFRDSIFTKVLSLGTEFFPLFLRKVPFHQVIVLKYNPKISSALRAEFPFYPSKTREECFFTPIF
jgi:hypothetical protein